MMFQGWVFNLKRVIKVFELSTKYLDIPILNQAWYIR